MARDASEARKLLEAELPTIRRIIRGTCRRRRLEPHDAQDFESYVLLKLVENDYRRLRHYEGKSSLSAYLITVTERLFLDFLVSKWGKWRPSAKSKALGPVAVALEKLVGRDGLSFDEAVKTLQADPRLDLGEEELDALASKLPFRRRPREVGCEPLETKASPPGTDRVESGEKARAAEKLQSRLKRALSHLSEEDRLLLRMRFAKKLTAKEIGRVLDERPSRVYTRIERVLRQLRRELEGAGFSGRQVAGLLEWSELDLNLAGFLEPPASYFRI